MNNRRAAFFIVAGMLSSCGGGENPAANYAVPPPPTTLAPSTFADLSAVVTSPQQGLALNCRDDVRARVTVTNRGGTSVKVTGVKRTTTIVSGRCIAPPDYTYGREIDFALPASATVLLDQALYTNGSGCCPNERSCRGACDIKDDFTVLTDLGLLPAGYIEYAVEFSNCLECAASASSRTACRPALRLHER